MTDPADTSFKEISELQILLNDATESYATFKSNFDQRTGGFWSDPKPGVEGERVLQSDKAALDLDDLKARYNLYVDLSSREEDDTTDGLTEVFEETSDVFDDMCTTYLEVFSKTDVLLSATERVLANSPGGGAIEGPENINELLTTSVYGISATAAIELAKFLWKFKKQRDAVQLARTLDGVSDTLRTGRHSVNTFFRLASAADKTGDAATVVRSMGKVSKLRVFLGVAGVAVAGYAIYAKITGDKELKAHFVGTIPAYEAWYADTFKKVETLHTVMGGDTETDGMIDQMNEILTAYGATTVTELLENLDYAIKSVGEYDGLLQSVDRMICAGKRGTANAPTNDEIRRYTGLSLNFIAARRAAALLDTSYCDDFPEPASD